MDGGELQDVVHILHAMTYHMEHLELKGVRRGLMIVQGQY